MLKNPVVLSDSSATAEDCEQEEDRGGKRKRNFCVNSFLPYLCFLQLNAINRKCRVEILAG